VKLSSAGGGPIIDYREQLWVSFIRHLSYVRTYLIEQRGLRLASLYSDKELRPPQMIGCIAVLLLHAGGVVPVLAPIAVAPAITETSLPDAPVAKLESRPLASYDLPRKDYQTGTPSVVPANDMQDSQSLSAIHVPELQPAEPAPAIPAVSIFSQRSWIISTVIQHSAATFDAYSTRRAIREGADEDDPLMRPFAHSPSIYAAIQFSPFVLDVVSRHMLRSQNSFLRRTWWLPQAASTSLFILSGIHDLQLSRKL
jgi:hypothetical protein